MVNIRSACLAAAAVLALSVHAAPTPNAALLSRRQDATEVPFGEPRTIQTHNSTIVNGGQVVTDCSITFTNIKDGGVDKVREVKKCTQVFVPNGAEAPPPPATVAQPPPVATSDPVPPAQSSDPVPPASTPDPVPPTSTPDPATPAEPTPAPSDTTTAPADLPATSATTEKSADPPLDQPANPSAPPEDEPAGTPPIIGDASTTLAANESESVSTESPTDGGETAPTSAPAGGVTTSDGTSAPSSTTRPEADNTATGTRANSEASETAAQVKVPGKSIEVLPIGLGVFAGISVIAMIVVGLTTYERTKYRRAFRQRRLAASGAEMGYGGMSERR